MPAALAPNELLELLKQRLNIETSERQTGNTELARRLGWDTQYATQRMRNWARNGAQPSYEETWEMLDALGWLQMERRPIEWAEELVKQLEAGEQVPREELREAAKAVDRVAVGLPRLADRLREAARGARQVR